MSNKLLTLPNFESITTLFDITDEIRHLVQGYSPEAKKHMPAFIRIYILGSRKRLCLVLFSSAQSH